MVVCSSQVLLVSSIGYRRAYFARGLESARTCPVRSNIFVSQAATKATTNFSEAGDEDTKDNVG